MAVEQINKYRSPIILGMLILFLLLLALYMLGIQPANRKLGEQETELSQLNDQNALLEKKIDERKSDASRDTEQAELLAQLPQGDNSEQLILDLRAIGALTGTRLKDVSFTVGDKNPIQEMTGSSTAAFPTVKQLNMTAVVEGDYTGIYNWMQALQSLPRIVNVDSFSFQRPADSGGAQKLPGVITANISFTAYFEEADNSADSSKSLAEQDSGQTAFAGQ